MKLSTSKPGNTRGKDACCCLVVQPPRSVGLSFNGVITSPILHRAFLPHSVHKLAIRVAESVNLEPTAAFSHPGLSIELGIPASAQERGA